MIARPDDLNASQRAYRGARVALLTQHGKERVIAPAIERRLGCDVELVSGYDTDKLGTFTRETPRVGTQLETARQKARIGMELAGAPFGLASEGSFGPDPYMGILPWSVEMVIFIDDLLGIEVVGVSQGEARSGHLLTSDPDEVESFARASGFPDHHLVVRPERDDDPRIRKGIDSWEGLRTAVAWARSEASNDMVFIEIDMRAYANPTRMEAIRMAAENLVDRISSCCPVCGAPGFWLTERVEGLLCSGCGSPTRQAKAEVRGCLKCSHEERVDLVEPGFADPATCDYCNP